VAFHCADALAHDLSRVTKAFVCNATFDAALNNSFVSVLDRTRAPRLQRVASLAPFRQEAVTNAGLQLSQVSAVAGSWAPAGVALYVYERAPLDVADAPAPSAAAGVGGGRVHVNRQLLEEVAAEQRRCHVADVADGRVSESEAMRGMMRSALMSVTVAKATADAEAASR
jgi:hypothetical protein